MSNIIQKLVDVPTTDPDVARRTRLLNILLAGFILIAFIAVIIIGVSIVIGALSMSEFGKVFASALAFLVGSIIILIINRYWSGFVASSAFLIFLTLVFS